jgi:hypothetical protein
LILLNNTFIKSSSAKIFTLCFVCSTFVSFNEPQSKKTTTKYLISGTITSTSSFCGGARPSEEILGQIETPRPFPHKKIYIKKGRVNLTSNDILVELKTDANGKFKTRLAPGVYLIVDEAKKDLTYYNTLLKEHAFLTENFEAVDTVCLKEWFAKPDFTFEVKQTNSTNIHLNFAKECFNLPCTQFRGPYPP